MDPMKPTRGWTLLGAGVLAAAVGWGVVQVIESWFGRLLVVPLLAAGALWLLAGALLYWTYSSRPRLQRRPGAKPMPPLVAARTAALAMAASRIGAVVAGFYLGVAVAMIPSLGTPTGSSTFWAASLASLGAIVLTVGALWLEHVCRLPIGPPDDGSGAS